MAFLAKIRNYIKHRKNKSFRKSIQVEKSQKYLFQESQKIDRTKSKWSMFKKKGDRISPFSRFLQDKIYITQDFSQRQQFYLKSIGLFLIGASLYILLYSPYFLLSPSKVLIEGLDDGIDVSIAYRSIEDLYGENIFFIDESRVAKSIQEYQKNISLIRINRLYPNNLKILLSAYPVVFQTEILSVPDKKWGLTENGILIPGEKMDTSTGVYLMKIVDTNISEDSLLDYKEIIPREKSIIIKKTLDTFFQSWPNIPVSYTIYLQKENELHINLKNGGRIFLTLQDFTRKTGETIDYKQLTSEFITLKTFIENHTADIEAGAYVYIDARIPGRIFSCREKILCEKNISSIYPDLTPTR